MTYMRDDIYYCPDCGQFFDEQTQKLIEVLYTEMPTDFAGRVMQDRKNPSNKCHSQQRRRKGSNAKSKGFAN